MKAKVVHLLEWFELGGGLEKVAGEIVSGLDSQRFDAEIWCVDRGGKLVDEYRAQGIVVRVLGISSYHNIFNILKLARLLKEARVDILHTHVYFAATIGRVAAKMAGVKVCINHVHSTYWHYSRINLCVEWVLAQFTDRILCVSGNVRDFVVGHEHIDGRKTLIVHNGITRRQTRPRVTAVPVVISVGSLLPNKGHEVLLLAMSLLHKRYPSIICRIVGEGPLDGKLKKIVDEEGLGHCVEFLGVRADVPDLLADSDIFVLPSVEREGLPVSVMEAMAYGPAVIASKVGGVPELIQDGINGVLVPARDVSALAASIEGLIMDTAKRQRLSSRATNDFNGHFDARVMVSSIEQVYEECLGKHDR